MNDKEFKKLLKKAHFDDPNTAFSDDVMRQIAMTKVVAPPLQPKRQLIFKPIIDQKTWYIVLGIVASVLVGVFMFPQRSVSPKSYFDHFDFSINDLMLQNNPQNLPFYLCLIVLSVLLYLDYVLRAKYHIRNSH